MDNKTGKLIAVAPLFDHNQSIIADWLGKDVTDTLSQMFPQAETLQSAMILTIKESDICIDNTKWNMLKKKYPEQEQVFTNIERRYTKIKKMQLLYSKKQYDTNEYMEKFSNLKQTSIHNHHSIDITHWPPLGGLFILQKDFLKAQKDVFDAYKPPEIQTSFQKIEESTLQIEEYDIFD